MYTGECYDKPIDRVLIVKSTDENNKFNKQTGECLKVYFDRHMYHTDFDTSKEDAVWYLNVDGTGPYPIEGDREDITHLYGVEAEFYFTPEESFILENIKGVTRENGQFSNADGWWVDANGRASRAEGRFTEANGAYSHVENEGGHANGQGSHAEGYFSIANGGYSHVEGNSCAQGEMSHAEGVACVAKGNFSHAEESAHRLIIIIVMRKARKLRLMNLVVMRKGGKVARMDWSLMRKAAKLLRKHLALIPQETGLMQPTMRQPRLASSISQ